MLFEIWHTVKFSETFWEAGSLAKETQGSLSSAYWLHCRPQDHSRLLLHLVIGGTKRASPLIPGLTFCSVQMDQYHQCHVKLRCMKNGSLAQLFWRNIFSSYRSFLLAGSRVLASPVGWLCMKTDVTCFAIEFNHKLFSSKIRKFWTSQYWFIISLK